jgi:probable HAF family extracellular repeat protein
MNEKLSDAAARPWQVTQFASGRRSKSKRLVVRRRPWKCGALSLVMMAAVALLTLIRPAAAQGCVGTLGPCLQALGFLDPLSPNRSSVGLAISPDGSVVAGESTNSSGLTEAFRWIAGTMSGLGFPSCPSTCSSYIGGVNQQGIISGYLGPPPYGPPAVDFQPYTWSNGSGTPLGLLPGIAEAVVSGIAAQSNVIAGSGNTIPFNLFNTAIVWRDGVPFALSNLTGVYPSSFAQGVSGDGRIIVGASVFDPNNQALQAVMWRENIIAPLPFLKPGDNDGFALAANADGSIILGTSGVRGEPDEASVLWEDGSPSSIGSTGIGFSTIDATGQVTAGMSIAQQAAYRWTSADGIQSIRSLLNKAGVDTASWREFEAAYVNGNGRVFAGYGTDPNGALQAFIARLPLPASLVTMHTHDFSGEGKSDLLWRGLPSPGPLRTFPVAVWTMNGAMAAQSAAIGAIPSNWAIVGQRDFNGDGYADILWRDSSGNLSIWFMNGAQVSSAVGVGNVPNNWAVHGTGDLSGDGKGDLLWRDSASGAVAAWFMDGGNVLATANFGTVPSSWAIVAVDNRGDILWQESTGNLAIWQINGTEIVQTASLGNVPPGSGWSVAGIGDFNGDGFIDILWRNGTGAVAIWFSNVNAAQNNLPYIAYTTGLGLVPPSFNILQTGDYNGDGYSDILWQDNQGNIAIWFLAACGNVACVSSAAGVGNVALGSWTLQALNVE